jgi:hypothetical protein
MFRAANTSLDMFGGEITNAGRAAAAYEDGLQEAGEVAADVIEHAHATALDYTNRASALQARIAQNAPTVRQLGGAGLEMVESSSSYSGGNGQVDTSRFRKAPEQHSAPIYSLVEKVRKRCLLVLLRSFKIHIGTSPIYRFHLRMVGT